MAGMSSKSFSFHYYEHINHTEEQAQSSWWGYASTAWSSIQETAKDFTDSLQEENEETINQIKERVDTETISNQISNATNSINTFLNTTIQTINTQNNSNPNHTKPKKQIAPKLIIFIY